MQTLDNLLSAEKISFLQYLDRLPNGMIPKKQELIDELKAQIEQEQQVLTDKQVQYEKMAKFMETLPPEIQNQLKALPPEQMEQQIMNMMQAPM
jgi:hypothetical protein